MKYLMFDLETLGSNLILQIGACYFDIEGNIYDKFLINVSIADSMQKGSKVDYGELRFWLENKHQITWLKNSIPLTKALLLFKEFVKNKIIVWSHYYDVMILENVCRMLKQKLPFHYKNWRDIRTLTYLSNFKREKTNKDPKSHNALEDCIYQVDYVSKCLRKLNFKIDLPTTAECLEELEYEKKEL